MISLFSLEPLRFRGSKLPSARPRPYRGSLPQVGASLERSYETLPAQQAGIGVTVLAVAADEGAGSLSMLQDPRITPIVP